MKRLILSLAALAGCGLFAAPAVSGGAYHFEPALVVRSEPRCPEAARAVSVAAGPDAILPGGAPGLGEPEADARSRYTAVFPDGHQMTVIGGGYDGAAVCRPAARVVCRAPAAACAPVAACRPGGPLQVFGRARGWQWR